MTDLSADSIRCFLLRKIEVVPDYNTCGYIIIFKVGESFEKSRTENVTD